MGFHLYFAVRKNMIPEHGVGPLGKDLPVQVRVELTSKVHPHRVVADHVMHLEQMLCCGMCEISGLDSKVFEKFVPLAKERAAIYKEIATELHKMGYGTVVATAVTPFQLVSIRALQLAGFERVQLFVNPKTGNKVEVYTHTMRAADGQYKPAASAWARSGADPVREHRPELTLAEVASA